MGFCKVEVVLSAPSKVQLKVSFALVPKVEKSIQSPLQSIVCVALADISALPLLTPPVIKGSQNSTQVLPPSQLRPMLQPWPPPLATVPKSVVGDATFITAGVHPLNAADVIFRGN